MNTKPLLAAVLGLTLLAAVGAGSYLLGRHAAGTAAQAAATPHAASPADITDTHGARRILYYRNPMGLPDTSPTPKKDSMGMDYIPVYADESAATEGELPGFVRISAQKVQKLGVRTEEAAPRVLQRTLRAAGRVAPDERRVSLIAPRFEGWVERLHVNATGQRVERGQPLFEVYSPELLLAQREYAIALQGEQALQATGSEGAAGMKRLAEAALARLRNWELQPEDLAALTESPQSTQVRRTLPLRSPVSGIVTEKKAVQGMRFAPGEVLYQVTDLSSVWVLADVFEQDIAEVTPGARARITLAAHPGRDFSGTVDYVYPTLDEKTRTVPVRIVLANPQHLLKPAMYAQVELQSRATAPVPAVPDSALIDSGRRRIVLVQRGEGRFEPREVQTGQQGEGYVEVRQGLQAGERVVVAANFLIDAESNLQAALQAMSPAAAASSAASVAASGAKADAKAGTGVVHPARGRIEEVDAAAGTLMLEHEPVAALAWPAMTMEFRLANPALLGTLKPGAAVDFDFVERAPGEWVITRLQPRRPTQGR